MESFRNSYKSITYLLLVCQITKVPVVVAKFPCCTLVFRPILFHKKMDGNPLVTDVHGPIFLWEYASNVPIPLSMSLSIDIIVDQIDNRDIGIFKNESG